jgi:hypothetical protein
VDETWETRSVGNDETDIFDLSSFLLHTDETCVHGWRMPAVRVGVGAQRPHARTTFVLRLGGVCRTLTSSSASSQLPSEPL